MKVVAVSSDLAAYLSSELGVPPSEIHVVYNGIRVASEPPKGINRRGDARRALGIPAEGKLVVFEREKVLRSPDLDAEVRGQLRNRLEEALQAVARQQQVKDKQDILREEQTAIRRDQQRLLSELELREQKLRENHDTILGQRTDIEALERQLADVQVELRQCEAGGNP